jgi:hypothetical protein
MVTKNLKVLLIALMPTATKIMTDMSVEASRPSHLTESDDANDYTSLGIIYYRR